MSYILCDSGLQHDPGAPRKIGALNELMTTGMTLAMRRYSLIGVWEDVTYMYLSSRYSSVWRLSFQTEDGPDYIFIIKLK